MPTSLEEFKSELVAVNQVHVNRKVDACDWSYKNKELFHNRTFWGRANTNGRLSQTPAQMVHGIFNELKDVFWTGTFTDKNLADTQAKQYGAEVEKEFYCDDENPAWFLIFDDFDKCTRFVYDELVKTGEL